MDLSASAVEAQADATVRVAPATASGLRRTDPAEQFARARVEVLDQESVSMLGAKGLAFRLARGDRRSEPAQARVTVDYSGFRYAYGGSFADRLRLVRLPACVLERPNDPACTAGQDVQAVNDLDAGNAVRGGSCRRGSGGRVVTE